MENVVFLGLLRRTLDDPVTKLNYWRSRDNNEVDFLVTRSGEPELAVQVCLRLTDPATRERELRALTQCMLHFKLPTGIIITANEEGLECFDNRNIQIVPIWKLLLEREFEGNFALAP